MDSIQNYYVETERGLVLRFYNDLMELNSGYRLRARIHSLFCRLGRVTHSCARNLEDLQNLVTNLQILERNGLRHIPFRHKEESLILREVITTCFQSTMYSTFSVRHYKIMQMIDDRTCCVLADETDLVKVYSLGNSYLEIKKRASYCKEKGSFLVMSIEPQALCHFRRSDYYFLQSADDDCKVVGQGYCFHKYDLLIARRYKFSGFNVNTSHFTSSMRDHNTNIYYMKTFIRDLVEFCQDLYKYGLMHAALTPEAVIMFEESFYVVDEEGIVKIQTGVEVERSYDYSAPEIYNFFQSVDYKAQVYAIGKMVKKLCLQGYIMQNKEYERTKNLLENLVKQMCHRSVEKRLDFEGVLQSEFMQIG